jgi:DNA-binding transcriptional LysR family regulator
MFSLYQLEIFQTVTQEGSFRKAGAQLRMTQPAVSHHMSELEAGFGKALFVRGNRGVKLTEAGEILQEYSRRILSLAAEAQRAVAQAGGQARLQIEIGATPGVGVYLLPGWIQAAVRDEPGLSIRLHTDTTSRIAAEVSSGQWDLGFVEGEIAIEAPLQALVLCPINLYVMVGNSHPWQGYEKRLNPQDLDGEPFIARTHGSQTRAWTDQIFARYGITPKIVAEFDHPEAIKQAVAAGMGVTILPEWVISSEVPAGNRLHVLPMEGLDLQRTLKLIWNGAAPFSAARRAFLAHLSEEYSQVKDLL